MTSGLLVSGSGNHSSQMSQESIPSLRSLLANLFSWGLPVFTLKPYEMYEHAALWKRQCMAKFN